MGSALRGHGLLHEGTPMELADESEWLVTVTDDGARWGFAYRHGGATGTGMGVCRCGATSPVVETARARQQWHREHKDAIRGES